MIPVEAADVVVGVWAARLPGLQVEIPAQAAVLGGERVKASLAWRSVVDVHAEEDQVLLG